MTIKQSVTKGRGTRKKLTMDGSSKVSYGFICASSLKCLKNDSCGALSRQLSRRNIDFL
jgi:hypothetical protein